MSGKVRVTGVIKLADGSLTAVVHERIKAALFDGHATPVATLEFRGEQALINWLPKFTATPDLLTALENLTDAAAKCGNLIPWPVYSAAREAIAKAKVKP